MDEDNPEDDLLEKNNNDTQPDTLDRVASCVRFVVKVLVEEKLPIRRKRKTHMYVRGQAIIYLLQLLCSIVLEHFPSLWVKC